MLHAQHREKQRLICEFAIQQQQKAVSVSTDAEHKTSESVACIDIFIGFHPSVTNHNYLVSHNYYGRLIKLLH